MSITVTGLISFSGFYPASFDFSLFYLLHWLLSCSQAFDISAAQTFGNDRDLTK
jgi:hypothetical protein